MLLARNAHRPWIDRSIIEYLRFTTGSIQYHSQRLPMDYHITFIDSLSTFFLRPGNQPAHIVLTYVLDI
jgi:hypothetical protein